MQKFLNLLIYLIAALCILIQSSFAGINQVELSVDYIGNPVKGKPLSFAAIYVGVVDTDPKIVINQKQISVLQEDGTTVAVTQPIYTSAGGVPLYGGSPVTIFADGPYSLRIDDSAGVQRYYVPQNVGSLDNIGYDSIADLRAIIYTPADGQIVNVLGYYAATENREWRFQWKAAEPIVNDDAGTIISVTALGVGCWVRLLKDSITPDMFGAIADGDGVGGGTDNTTALQSWASHTHKSKTLNGIYRCNDSIVFPKHGVVNGGGSGISKIDFSGATGAFAGNKCVDFSQGSFSAISDLNANVSKADVQIVFGAAHGLVRGDIFAIHNPTDGSWSAHLATYTKGEMCVVAEVVNATTVNLLEPLYDDYTAASVNCYKLDYGTVNMQGITFIGRGSDVVTITLFVSHVANSTFSDVSVAGGGDKAIDIRYAYNTNFDGTSYQYNSDVPGNAQYGLVVVHCQNMLIRGNFQGERHAVTTGGTSGAGGIVNRDIHISGNLKSLIRASLDFHGNTEFCDFDGGTLNGMCALGGDNNAVRNCTILGNDSIETGRLIRFREMLGCNFEFSNIIGISQGDPSADGGSGLIDAGGNNNTTLTALTTRGGALRFSNIMLEAYNSDSGIRLANRGCTQDIDVIINGLTPRLAATVTTTFGYIRLGNVSGGDFRSLLLDGVSNPDRHPVSTTLDVTRPPFGSFTPTLEFGGASVGITYAHQLGRYEINNGVINWWAEILLTSKGTSVGSAIVTGLPYDKEASTNLAPPVIIQSGHLTYAGELSAVHISGTNNIQIMRHTTAAQFGFIDNAGFANNTRLRLSGAYREK